jgi:colicin import membrane protein
MTLRGRAVLVVAALVGVAFPLSAFATNPNRIHGLKLTRQGDTAVVEIAGERAPNFTTFKQDAPRRVIVDVAECALGQVPADMQGDGGLIERITTAQYGEQPHGISRVVIGLTREAEYRVSTRGGSLFVVISPGAGGLLVSAGVPSAPERPARASEDLRLPMDVAPPPEADAEAADGDQEAGLRVAMASEASERPVAEAAEEPVEEPAAEPAPAEPAPVEPAPVAAAPAPAPVQPKAVEPAPAPAPEPAPAPAEPVKVAMAEPVREQPVARAPEPAPAKPIEPAARAVAQSDDSSSGEGPGEEGGGEEVEEVEEVPEVPEEGSGEAAPPPPAAEEAPPPAAEEAPPPAAEEVPPPAAEEVPPPAAEEVPPPAAEEVPSAAEEVPSAAEEVPPPPPEARPRSEVEERVEISGALKDMTWVGFQQTRESSRVFVKTNAPVKYRVVEEDGNLVVLELENAHIPVRNNRRFLDTHFFDTAVTLITPREIEGVSRNVRIEIQLRNRVPFTSGQEDNLVFINFQRAN